MRTTPSCQAIAALHLPDNSFVSQPDRLG